MTLPGTVLRLKPSSAGEEPMMRSLGRSQIEATASNLDFLLRLLSHSAGRPILNQTGLHGTYDFNLKWTPDNAPSDPDAPSLFTAVQEQLGLTLQPQRAALDTLVIEHIDPPTEN